MKKILLLLLIFVFLIPISVKADSASSSVIMDINSGRILYSKDMNTKRLIASTTKIMTCIIVLENLDLNKKIKVGNEVEKMYGTNIYIKPGEKIKVIDLLYGLMLRSGNDAAITLAINTFKSEKEFVKQMNIKAKQLGMKNTIFENPHGLDESTKNYSTAYDMALLSKYSYKNKTYRKIISTKKYVAKSSLKTYSWYNRVSLLNTYKYCVGGKNGYTPKAGKSLVSIAKKNNNKFTIVTLDDNQIYENHTYLYKKYFSKYKTYTILDKKTFLSDSDLQQKKLYIKKSFSYPLTEDEKENITTLLKLTNTSKNKIAGEVSIKLFDKEIGKINVYQK